SRPAFPGRAFARKGRKAPIRAPTGSGQVRGADAGREGRLVIGDWGTDCSRKGRKGRKGLFFSPEKSFANVADLA
ncbi:MAG: hypothetical protein EBY83_08450, partial [Verrucomicrobia bacterium]|nr:hypothetical protein [Verrucomicrobiota bacterium]